MSRFIQWRYYFFSSTLNSTFSAREYELLQRDYRTYFLDSIIVNEIGHSLDLEHPWEHHVYDFLN